MGGSHGGGARIWDRLGHEEEGCEEGGEDSGSGVI
jgi:hypothetical protein